MDIIIVVLKFHNYCSYPLGFGKIPDYVNLCSSGWIQGVVLYVEVKLGIVIFCAP